MKFVLMLIGSAAAIQLKGKDYDSYFTTGPAVYSSGSHWRKFWPEGAVDSTLDNPDAEFEIIDRFNHPVPPPADPSTPHLEWHEYEPHLTSKLDQF